MDTKRPTPHRNEGRRLKIAAGVMAGKRLAEIGREEGVSRQTIWKQLASSDARQIIVALTNREIDRLSLLFRQVLQAIGEGLQARRVQVQDGVAIDLGPGDHYAQLTAVARFIQVLAAGRPTAKVRERRSAPWTSGRVAPRPAACRWASGYALLAMAAAPTRAIRAGRHWYGWARVPVA
jgi:hypothetical protein